MDLKEELKNIINERLKTTASPLFLGRALAVIEGTPNEKELLTAAADKVGKMISLFIGKELGKEMYGKLKEKIDKGFPQS